MKNKEIFLLHLAVMLFGLAGIIGKFVSLPAVIVTFGRVFFFNFFINNYFSKKRKNTFS